MEKNKLNLGCGRKPLEGYVNLDLYNFPGVDVIFDLNQFPYPFRDNSFDEVYCRHIIEHLDDIIKVMEELYRICENDAIIIIQVPHFTVFNALTDITHKKVFGWKSFESFDRPNGIRKYTNANFKVISKKINFSVGSYLKILNPIMNFLINKILLFRYNFYERFFCYIIPSEEIIFKLKVVK